MNPTQKQAAFLEESNICVIATASASGQPQATPVWYLYDGGVITLLIEKESQKHRNLSANPKISLAFDRRERPYYALMVNGTAELDSGVTYNEIHRLATRYLGEEAGREYADASDMDNLLFVRLEDGRFSEHMAGE